MAPGSAPSGKRGSAPPTPRRLTITVQGWRERGGSGAIWAPNRLVGVVDDWLDIERDMLIAGVGLARGADGTTATLVCYLPGAFELRALPEPEISAGSSGDGGLGGWLF